MINFKNASFYKNLLITELQAPDLRARVQGSFLIKNHCLDLRYMVHVKSVVGATSSNFSVKSMLQGESCQTNGFDTCPDFKIVRLIVFGTPFLVSPRLVGHSSLRSSNQMLKLFSNLNSLQDSPTMYLLL